MVEVTSRIVRGERPERECAGRECGPEVPQERVVAVDVDADPRWVAAAVLRVAVLAPECVVVLVEPPAVRVHAREHDDVQVLDDRADRRGAERLPAVDERCPVRVRLEQVGGEVDADLRAAPFARVSAGGEQDTVTSGV